MGFCLRGHSQMARGLGSTRCQMCRAVAWQGHWHAKRHLLGKLWVCCCSKRRLVWVACQKWLACYMVLRCGCAKWRLRPSIVLHLHTLAKRLRWC